MQVHMAALNNLNCFIKEIVLKQYLAQSCVRAPMQGSIEYIMCVARFCTCKNMHLTILLATLQLAKSNLPVTHIQGILNNG